MSFDMKYIDADRLRAFLQKILESYKSKMVDPSKYPIDHIDLMAFLAREYQALILQIDSLPEETYKDSLQVQEICKENTDSFTSLKDDLVLTWEDMAKIDAIILDVNNEFAVDYSKKIDRQKFYEEVLKRFKEVQK